jgi:Cytochrome P460
MNTRLLIALSLLSLSLRAQSDEPRYTSDGQLMRPDNYREWIFLSSGLGMTYSNPDTAAAANTALPRFDNVFVTPQAYQAFLKTGAWPDKTMFALEVRSSASKGSINKGGHYQDEIVALEIEVKDQSRFPNQWAYFGFGGGAQQAKPRPASAGCQACHSTNGAVENTFVQFYPTLLPVAKAKGTLKPLPTK